MKVRELGEFGLIELVAGIVGKPSRRDILLGIGDDAAAWRTSGSVELATTDILIEDVHFTLANATWRELGWKALAINISDIAAMGGSPAYALVSLGVPPDTEVESVAELYRGMMDAATEYGVDICGGNMSSAPVAVINLTVVGETSSALLTRSAALPGDRIAVTGYLGQAAAGLEMLKSGLQFDRTTTAFLREAHLRPRPRVAEGQILAQHGVKAAIDLSDGLLSDLGHICKASRVGASVWMHKLPIHPLVKAAFDEESPKLALSGGEDYELLFTASDEILQRVRAVVPVPVTAIGEIVSDEHCRITLCDSRGKPVEHGKRGWEHFRPAG